MSVAPTPTELLTAETRPYRGIREDTMNFFGVQTLVGQDGEAKKQAYIYPSGGRKIRSMPKAFHTEAGFRVMSCLVWTSSMLDHQGLL